MPKSFKYLEQNCVMTLNEGLHEYTSNYKHLNDNSGGDDESRFFRNHDYTHVVFGTIPFQLRGESINDTWTIFGSDVTLKGYFKIFDYVDYNLIVKQYLKDYGSKFKFYLAVMGFTPVIIKTIYRSKRMKKKWPWYEPDQFGEIPLNELRETFGIKVIDPYTKNGGKIHS